MSEWNFFIWIAGVTELAENARNRGQESMLKLFGFFVCMAFLASFSCVFLPSSINLGIWAAIIAGTAWATAVITMDRLLFAANGVGAIVLRGGLILLTSLITSFAFRFGLDDTKIVEQIEYDTDARNREQITRVEEMKKPYLDRMAALDSVLVRIIEKNPDNELAVEVIEKIKEQQREIMRELEEKLQRFDTYFDPDLTIGNKLSTYWNMPKEKKFGGAWWFVFIMEMLPLFFRFTYRIFYGN